MISRKGVIYKMNKSSSRKERFCMNCINNIVEEMFFVTDWNVAFTQYDSIYSYVPFVL